ncbi:MAG: glycine cleavage system aminomethyltransferase GcvT, partial [Candidatus Altiarchaeota archaeon]|nr:glycine cleavage system aminomethyltransferase GcvT [Candidatus Altiarchaeota archaeon]
GVHVKLGARVIDFGGWLMPVQYSGVIEEHECVRNRAGLFDVSHMGEFLVSGPKSAEFLNTLVTNDVSKMADGQCLYTPMCYENGTIVDDLIIYKHNSQSYMLVVNASNISKDYEWAGKSVKDGVKLSNVSDKTAEIAIQGPLAEKILQKLSDSKLSDLQYMHFKDNVKVSGVKALVSRTGYTGEDGFEAYVDYKDAVKVWNALMDAGKEHGIMPAGLGARDTLRLEAALMLYGNDIDDTTTPFEAKIGWTVKLDKGDFTGRTVLAEQKDSGVKKKLVGFEMVEKGIPRHGYEINVGSRKVGYVTSGTFSPTLKKSIGLGYVETEYSKEGTMLSVMIRGSQVAAKVVPTPFYKRKKEVV